MQWPWEYFSLYRKQRERADRYARRLREAEQANHRYLKDAEAAKYRAAIFESRYNTTLHDLERAHAHIKNLQQDMMSAARLGGTWHEPKANDN
jgi:hypothetical protein